MAKKKTEDLTVRRAPKFLSFLLLGAVTGIIAAIIVNAVAGGQSEVPILGYLMVYFGVVGMGLSLSVSLVIDLVSRAKSRVVKAERSR